MASEKDKLLEEKGSREADEKRRLDAAQADIQTERETIQAMNQSLDETNQELKEKLADEITHRLVRKYFQDERYQQLTDKFNG